MASAGGFRSRDEARALKELDEARKAGTAEPQRDEDGNDISPHIPEFISKAPWYLAKDGPTLKHQRLQSTPKAEKRWYKRGLKKGPVAKKYRKGACENCGAMGHSKKDCFERPRKVAAKFLNTAVAADDLEQPELELDYEAKHDRWNGFDPAEYQRVIDLQTKVEKERRRLLKQKATEEAKASAAQEGSSSAAAPAATAAAAVATNAAKAAESEESGDVMKKLLDDMDDDEEDDDDLDDGTKLKGDEDQVGSKVDSKRRITVRNLRIREDTAKYLLNLDLESAFYDPKTRSMRANPTPGKDEDIVDFVGENFMRSSGQVKDFNEVQQYATEAGQRGQSQVHMQAAPSQLELAYKQYKEQKEKLKEQEKKKILEQYGGEEHLKAVPHELLLGQTEKYVEYSADGKVLRGDDAVVRSKWEEDVHPGNHSAIWGSYWENGKWGYACCQQFVRAAYCTGEAGKAARVNVLADKDTRMRDAQAPPDAEAAQATGAHAAPSHVDEREALRQALEEEELRQKRAESNDRKRTYNSMRDEDVEVTDAQLEAYRMKRQRTDDPMADYLAEKKKK